MPSPCAVYACFVLVAALVILVPAFVGAYWNTLAMILFAFGIWLYAAQNQAQIGSALVATKWIFWFVVSLFLINVIAIVGLRVKKDTVVTWLQKQGFVAKPTFRVWICLCLMTCLCCLLIAVLVVAEKNCLESLGRGVSK